MSPSMIRTKPSVFSPERGPIFDSRQATAKLDDYMKTDSFKVLHKDLREHAESLRGLLEFLDPSEAISQGSAIGQGLMKVGVFTSMREAAGMRGALLGGSAGFLTNMARQLTNPEVRELINRAARGQIQAAQALSRIMSQTALESLGDRQ